MKYIFPLLLVQLLVAMPFSSSYAGIAEASTGIYMQNYNLSDLSPKERHWFIKFIEGNFFIDGWQDIADDILVKMSEEQRRQKEFKLYKLGNKIGREWCKDNDIRKIDTAMLKKWGRMLKSTAENDPHLLANIIDHINGEVDALID